MLVGGQRAQYAMSKLLNQLNSLEPTFLSDLSAKIKIPKVALEEAVQLCNAAFSPRVHASVLNTFSNERHNITQKRGLASIKPLLPSSKQVKAR